MLPTKYLKILPEKRSFLSLWGIEVRGGRWEEGKQWIKTNCKRITAYNSAWLYFLGFELVCKLFALQNSQINSVYSLPSSKDSPWRPLFSKCLEDCLQQKSTECLSVAGVLGNPETSSSCSFEMKKFGSRCTSGRLTASSRVTGSGRPGPSPRGAHSAVGEKDADKTSCKTS